MNCPQCNTELPSSAVFCPQCGNQIVESKSIFPPVPQNQRQKGQLTRSIGCACGLGALLLIVIFAGTALLLFDEDAPLSGGPPEKIKTGANFNLYGRTIQDEDFDWESLRGKYVLVKFTATWCPSCQLVIPGMLEAYEKYHDKGLEVISVYIGESEPNAVTTVKNHVKGKKLPWTIISESLTIKAGHPHYGDSFHIPWVPTMVLVDKEGNVIATDSNWEPLKRELEKLFEE